MAPIRYRTAVADGFKVFYREAGNTAAPKLLLLHGKSGEICSVEVEKNSEENSEK